MRRGRTSAWKPYNWRSWRWWPRWVWLVAGVETLYLVYFTVSFRAAPEEVRLPMFEGGREVALGAGGFVSTMLWINLWIVVGLWLTARLEMRADNERGIALVVLPPALVLLAISVLIWQFDRAWWLHSVDTVIERWPDGGYGIVTRAEGSTVTGLHEWVDSLGGGPDSGGRR